MVTIRLTRVGSKKRPLFRVVVVEHREARDGSFVESLGFYNPRRSPELFELNHERFTHWVKNGATPSNTVRTLVARHPAPPAPAATETAAP
jgi:small subunit ribosomal protein S16